MTPDASIPRITGHNYRADFLAVATATGFLAVTFSLIFHIVPDGSREPFLVLAGLLGGAFKDIIGYEFGASQPDKTGDQAAIIRQLSKGAPSANPPS